MTTKENETYYIVEDWMGNVLYECETLQEADTFKDTLCYDEDEEIEDSKREDIYIVGINSQGEIFPPQW